MYEYTNATEPFRLKNNTLKVAVKVSSIVAAAMICASAVNTADTYFTDGITVLSITAAITAATIIVAAMGIRWLNVRDKVSDSNLSRSTGDQIFRFLGTLVAVALVPSATALALQVADISVVSTTHAGIAKMFEAVSGLVNATLTAVR